MKNGRAGVMAAFVLLCGMSVLCGCGKSETDRQESVGNKGIQTVIQPENKGENAGRVKEGELKALITLENSNYAACSTPEGYYYITEDLVELKDGSWGSHIMYVDFASGQEVFLCSDTGCTHNEESCTAVLSDEEFVPLSCKIFVWNGKLYILNKDYDEDGSVVIDFEGGAVAAESRPSVLYQMNPDGTGRKKVYTFEEGVILEDLVIAGAKELYFAAKKLETAKEGTAVMTTASERKLIKLDMEKGKTEDIFSLNTEQGISYKVTGCFENCLVLEGTAYENGDSGEWDMEQEEWKELYRKSKNVIAVYDLAENQCNQVYQLENTKLHSTTNQEGILYVSKENSGEIQSVDLKTGEAAVLASLNQNSIIGKTSDKLICQNWDTQKDASLYFVDLKSGEVSHCGLVNLCNGWPLEIVCEAGEEFMVIYDYEAEAYGDGSYEIYRYQFGMIKKQDLYAGKNEFRPVSMTGKGR